MDATQRRVQQLYGVSDLNGKKYTDPAINPGFGCIQCVQTSLLARPAFTRANSKASSLSKATSSSV